MCNKNEASMESLQTIEGALREPYKAPELVSTHTLKVAVKEVPFVLEVLNNSTE